jgi:uncharacterized SAM-binding protein YcdF (DUF218 family)
VAGAAKILLVTRIAIVVPGASVRTRGRGWILSPTCLACVEAARRLAEERRASAVVFTGYAPGGGASEAEQMRAAWRGPVETEVVVEPHARNTAENAARTVPLLLERRIDEAIVVCSRIHHARVRFFFGRLYREAGIAVELVTVRAALSPRAVLREVVAAPLAWSQRRRVTSGQSDRGGAR